MSSSPPPRSSIAPHVPEERENRNTILPAAFYRTGAGLGTRLAAEASRIAAHFDSSPSGSEPLAARVALLAHDGLYLDSVRADPHHYLCVGRHSEASLRSESSESLSLRHVLLIPQPLGDVGVQLDVVPLAPTMAVAPWTEPLPSTLAGRCSPMVLGDALLLIAGVGISQRESSVKIPPAATQTTKRAERPEPAPPTSEFRTRLSSIHELLSIRPNEPAVGPLVLEVRSEDRMVTIRLREDWLAQGVVIGRSDDKCSHAALAALLTSVSVSRCHVFLRREGDAIVFYDTASTSGLWLDDEQVRRVAIPAPRAILDDGIDEDLRDAAVNPRRIVLMLTDVVSVTLRAARRDAAAL